MDEKTKNRVKELLRKQDYTNLSVDEKSELDELVDRYGYDSLFLLSEEDDSEEN